MWTDSFVATKPRLFFEASCWWIIIEVLILAYGQFHGHEDKLVTKELRI